MTSRFPILWLTGNTGAGKSTLAFGLRSFFNEEADASHPLARRVVVLDGDEMRATISVDETLTPEDRRKHNLRVARLAKLLSEAGHLVVVAVIAPFASVREEVNAICAPQWIYVKRESPVSSDRPYEVPINPDFLIDNDAYDIEQARALFVEFALSHTCGLPAHSH